MKRLLMIFFGTMGIVGALQLAPVHVSAQFDAAKKEACEGVASVDEEGAANNCDGTAANTGIKSTLEFALNLISIIAGVIAVIMVVISGIKFMTSQGDPGQVSSARQSIIYAVVGVVIVALSQVIVNFVVSRIG